MRITGGVVDERVFGDYGPDVPSKVLATLLDGTGSNMLLLDGADNRPAELMLTPRTGGPSPPNPSAAIFNERQTSAPVLYSPPSPAAANQSQPAEAPVAPGVTPSVAAPAADGAQPDSPNGVKTPQQIYEQLQRLRQQPSSPQ